MRKPEIGEKLCRANLKFGKPKRKPKSRSAKKKRDGRECKERLEVLHKSPFRCAVCGGTPEVHHVRTKGNRSKDDFRTIPLCQKHHSAQGSKYSVHGTPAEFAEHYGESGEDVLPLINNVLVKIGSERLVKP